MFLNVNKAERYIDRHYNWTKALQFTDINFSYYKALH